MNIANIPEHRAKSPRTPLAWVGVLGLFFALLCSSLAATAQPDHTRPGAPAEPFATVWRIQGTLVASGVGAVPARQLREGDAVYVGEKLRAAGDSEAVLKTGDAGMIAVRPLAEFVVEAYEAQGKTSDQFATRLLTGSLRMITGWVGKLNPAGVKVSTTTAVIGIRGTDHEPYVLTPELAASVSGKEGVYDKVNRGGTRLEVGDFKLDIDPGKVGFARAPSKTRERALMTILLPVLLDKIPDFYVPGRFDAELDQFSLNPDAQRIGQLTQAKPEGRKASPNQCAPSVTAAAWLGQLDAAVARADAATLIGMFAPEVKIRATVRGPDGSPSTLDLQREELVSSTLAALKDLKEYKQRRVSTDAREVTDQDTCLSILVKSVVTERGLQGGKPFRFDSVEEYQLIQRRSQWLAVKAETTQR